jgi:site-specific recombinase XerD
VVEKTFVSDFTFHSLRHTYASHLKEAGGRDSDVSYYLGHASVDFTRKVYVHLYARAERADVVRQATTSAFGGLAAGPAPRTGPQSAIPGEVSGTSR